MDRRIEIMSLPPLKEEVRGHFEIHINEWFTTRQIADMTGLKPAQVRQGAERLVIEGYLISQGDRRSIQKSYRTKMGFMKTSKFQDRGLPEVIWIGEDVVVGPFCQHCGNPLGSHGLEGECLNYRIHPLMPLGDLPLAGRSIENEEN